MTWGRGWNIYYVCSFSGSDIDGSKIFSPSLWVRCRRFPSMDGLAGTEPALVRNHDPNLAAIVLGDVPACVALTALALSFVGCPCTLAELCFDPCPIELPIDEFDEDTVDGLFVEDMEKARP